MGVSLALDYLLDSPSYAVLHIPDFRGAPYDLLAGELGLLANELLGHRDQQPLAQRRAVDRSWRRGVHRQRIVLAGARDPDRSRVRGTYAPTAQRAPVLHDRTHRADIPLAW